MLIDGSLWRAASSTEGSLSLKPNVCVYHHALCSLLLKPAERRTHGRVLLRNHRHSITDIPETNYTLTPLTTINTEIHFLHLGAHMGDAGSNLARNRIRQPQYYPLTVFCTNKKYF